MTDLWKTQDLMMSQSLSGNANKPPKGESRVLQDAAEKSSVPQNAPGLILNVVMTACSRSGPSPNVHV